MVKLGWKDKMPFPGQYPVSTSSPGLCLCWHLPSGSWRPRLLACVVPCTPMMEQGHVPQGYGMTAPGPCGGGVDREVRAM